MNSDNFSNILSHPEVSSYLSRYPKRNRPQVLLDLILSGIQVSKFSRSPKQTSKPRVSNKHGENTSIVPRLRKQLIEFQGCLNLFEQSLQNKPGNSPSVWSSIEEQDQQQLNFTRSPKMVDFWSQTPKRPSKHRVSTKDTQKRKPWAQDFTHIVKGHESKKTSPKAVYKPPDHPIYEPNLRGKSVESELSSSHSSEYLSDEMKKFYKAGFQNMVGRELSNSYD